MLPGDRLIVAFVERQEVGRHFKSWLLHVTVVPWFRLPDNSGNIAQGLARAVAAVEPFEVVGEGKSMFGPKKNRPVRLLAEPTPFAEIEAKVRNYFHKKRAWLVDETTKRRQQFRPHVTAQGRRMLNENETFKCDCLYLVEQHGDYKEIVAIIPLGTDTHN